MKLLPNTRSRIVGVVSDYVFYFQNYEPDTPIVYTPDDE